MVVDSDWTTTIVWFIVFAVMGGLLRRVWTLLFGSAIGLVIGGMHAPPQYFVWICVAAIVFAVVAILFFVKDYQTTKDEIGVNP